MPDQQQNDGPFRFDPAAFAQQAQNDPEMVAGLDSVTAPVRPEDQPRNAGAPVSTLWERIKQKFSRKAENNNPLDRAVTRGAMDFVNNTSDAAVGATLAIGKATGLYKLGHTPEEQDAFLKNYEKPTSEVNPLRFSDDTIDRWSGPKQGAGWQLVSGMTSFALGMATTGGLASGAMGEIGGAGKIAGAVRGVVKNAVVDMTALDQHQERLANVIEGTPLANPITHFLAAKEDDGELEARLKGALEGQLIGGMMHVAEKGIARVADVVAGQVKALRLAKSGDAEGAAQAITEAEDAAVQPRPTDVAKVVQATDGAYEVHPVDGSSTEVPKYGSLEEAAASAEALNFVSAIDAKGFDASSFGDPETVSRWKEALAAYQKTKDMRSAATIISEYGYNPRNFTSPAEIKETIKAMVDVGGEAMMVGRQGAPEDGVSRLATGQAAMELNASWKTPQEAYDAVAKIHGDTETLPAQVNASRLLLLSTAKKAHTASMLADALPENPVAMQALSDALTQLHNVHAMVTGTVSSIGRTLDSLKIDVNSLADGVVKTGREVAQDAKSAAAGDVFDPIKGLTKTELRDLARSVFMGDPDDPGAVLAAIRGSKQTAGARVALEGDKTAFQKVRDIGLSWRMQAMLSGPVTHVGNIMSNTSAMFTRATEHWWAGIRSGDRELRQFGADMLAPTQLAGDAMESLSATLKAFKTGQNVLEGSDPFDIGGLVSTNDLRDASGNMLFGNMLKFIGTLPSRLLMTSDEFFKQMNYRMNARAQILQQARSQGVDAVEMARRLSDMEKFMFKSENGISTGEAANAWALQYSRVSTFTNELGQVMKGLDENGNPVMADSMGKRLQDFANNHTVGRLILPFVKTPVNIFRFSAERTPGLARFTEAFQADLRSGDPQRIAVAKAKTDLGAAVWTVAVFLGYNKTITGKGPSDPGLRDELKAAGWRPYSMRIGDRYVSFRRGDPVFTALSVAADLVETSSEMMHGGSDEWKTLPAAFVAAVAASVTSKSFLQGLSQTLDAVSSGKGSTAQALFDNTVGSFIPTALRTTDPNDGIMETRSMMDEMMARVPGFSQTLETKRDLFGRPVVRPPGFMNGVDNMVNPFTVSGKVKPASVMNELVKLGKSIPMPPETIQNGQIDLTNRDLFTDRKRPDGQYQSPYDRMMELLSKTDAEKDVTDLIQSEEYKTMSEDEKYLVASSLIHGYQDVAYAQMLNEYPSVVEALGQEARLRGASLVGGEDAVKAQSDEIRKTAQLFVRRKGRYNPAMPE